MIFYKTDEEIELMRASNRLVGQTLGEVGKWIKAGVSTLKLDQIAEEFICDHGAKPGFLGYNGFPNTLCVSLNDEVVHGIPSEKRLLKEGDLVSVDCGVLKQGFYGDSAYTFAVGEIKDTHKELMQITKECLYQAIEAAVSGNRLGDIGYAIQHHAEAHGFSVVRDLTGHGIGKRLHEDPQVPGYGKRGRGRKLKQGLVIAIEPMVNMGTYEVLQHEDGWTMSTADQQVSAHYEHTIAIRNGVADVLSTFEYIEHLNDN